MLREYLPAFTTTSASAGATIYLDLFAGTPGNTSRTGGAVIEGSPRIALSTRPPFTKVVLFELPNNAGALNADLQRAFPGRDFEVIEGDCNRMLDSVLTRLESLSYAASWPERRPAGR